MQNQFNEMSVFECQISENTQKLNQEEFKDLQVLLYKFKDIQGLEFLFSSNTMTFNDFQVLYEPCRVIYRLEPEYFNQQSVFKV